MTYDAIVIGCGQSGSPLCNALADHGWSVALIEKGYLGGTCINVGCTPTKTMVHRAQVAYYARNAERWGVNAHDVTIDLPKIVAQKDKVVQIFRNGKESQVAKRPKMKLYRQHGRFVGPHTVQVDDDVLESEHIFIDTGARPFIPDIPGLQEAGYLTNETIMALTSLPEHLIVLGGGYIGLEFGQMFARFGSRVTVIQQTGQIVPREDPEVASELQKAIEADGVNFLLNTVAARVNRVGDSIVVSLADASGSFSKRAGEAAITGSHLLVATGRRPNTDDLGLL